jgi:GTPase SAR1 family protein
VVLVGNKCDLEDQRVVTTQQGEELAKKFGCPHFETSAKTRQNINELFFELVRQINKVEPPKKKDKKKCIIL